MSKALILLKKTNKIKYRLYNMYVHPMCGVQPPLTMCILSLCYQGDTTVQETTVKT